MTTPEVGTWDDVEGILQEQPVGVVMRIPKRWLSHPSHWGLTRIAGFPEGQMADYHKALPDGGRLHVREFHQWYEIHREEQSQWLDELDHEPPRSRADETVTGGAALGALIGSMLGESPRAAVAGAAVGGVLAAALLASAQHRARTE